MVKCTDPDCTLMVHRPPAGRWWQQPGRAQIILCTFLTPTTFTPMVGGKETEVTKKKKLSVYVCVTEHVRVLAAISHHRPD